MLILVFTDARRCGIYAVVGVLCFISLFTACSTAVSQDLSKAAKNASGGAGGGKGDEPTLEVTLTFEETGTLTLSPGETASVSVLVEPARRQVVTFEILSASPDFDGFLLEATSQVEDNGRAITEIQAPTQPSSFVVRASLSEDLEVRLPISVSSKGLATLHVTPLYSGDREINEWKASTHVGKSCDELDSYYEEGQLSARGKKSVTLTTLPSNTPVAITLSGGELAAGCVAVGGFGADTEEDVLIEISDRPLNIEEGELELSLGVESTTSEFVSHLERAIGVGIETFRKGNENDADALLGRIKSLLSDKENNEFEDNSFAFDYSSAILSRWEGGAVVAGTLSAKLNEASSQIVGDDTFTGTLILEGSSSGFFLNEAAGVPTAVSGFFEGSTWSISTESEDTLVMGGSLTYEPLRWLVAIANESSSEAPEKSLIKAAHCDSLATELIRISEGPTHGNCEVDCFRDLCEEALKRTWRDLETAGNGLLTTMQIGITGKARVVGPGQIDSFEGSWVGRLEGDETSIKGPVIVKN